VAIRIEDLDNIDFSDMAEVVDLPPVAPGEILSEEFLKPMGISHSKLAKELGIPARRITQIVAGKRAITLDTGLRLSRFFGMNDGFWVGLQLDYDTVRAKLNLGNVLAHIKPLHSNWRNP
jgi:addiction module HigA family antidote